MIEGIAVIGLILWTVVGFAVGITFILVMVANDYKFRNNRVGFVAVALCGPGVWVLVSLILLTVTFWNFMCKYVIEEDLED